MPSRNGSSPAWRGRALGLALVAALSVVMHLKGISSPLADVHYWRQSYTATLARNFHENGMRLLCPQIDWAGPYRGLAATEFPLFSWLTALLWPLAGLGELWGRLLATAFSALTAVYLFLLLEEDLGREAALYAGILFSFLPIEIFFGRTVQPEAMALCATVAAFYHWRLALGPARPWAHWAAATLAAFLAVSLKLPYVYLFAPLAWLSWERLGRSFWRDLRGWAAFGLALAGTAAWYKHASTGTFVIPSKPGEFGALLNYKLHYIPRQFISRFPELCATHLGLLPLAAGAVLFMRRRLFFYEAWFAAFGLSLVAGGSYTFDHEYTSLPWAPVNAAFMGAGLLLLREKASALRPRPKAWALAGLALLVAGMPVYSVLRIRRWYSIGSPALVRAAAAADRVSAPDDLFLCNSVHLPLFLFYLHRRGWGVGIEGDPAAAWAELDRRIAAGARFFFAPKSGPFQDREGETARRFYARFPVAYDQDGLLIFRLR
ncbi:MAG: glycosyltransferase family 39 protein [Elusimicrobia bacterium]|nr:glycosyltransferase family 39 protein [Elusimicrobiota bacterium]